MLSHNINFKHYLYYLIRSIYMPKRTYHIPIFVPHKGCPHDCVFCNQKKITGHTDVCDTIEIKTIVEEYLSSIAKNGSREDAHIEVAFFGGSFTGIDRDVQEEYMKCVEPDIKSGDIDGIRCSTRPDYIDDDILTMVKSYGMSVIELGVQSADDRVLSITNRGHSFADVENAAMLIKKHGISLGLQMMTGLPGDTPEGALATAMKIADLEPDCVRIYPTLVMEGTHLAKMYNDGIYAPQTLDEAVELVADIIPIFSDRNIDIIRIGLQTTDNVNADTVIGPYHPAFAELCYGRIERKRIEERIVADDMKACRLEISAPKSCFSKIIGHKKSNAVYFKEKYNIDIVLKEEEI